LLWGVLTSSLNNKSASERTSIKLPTNTSVFVSKTTDFFTSASVAGPFAKRDKIYNKVIITSPESMGGYILSRKRFNLIIIAWHYVNQAYFRRKDPNSYLQIPTFFRIDASVIKRFEGYYQVRLKHIGVVL
jgi:hypothetical protein